MNNQVFIPTKRQFQKILSETVESLLGKKDSQNNPAGQPQGIPHNGRLTGCSHRVQHYLRSEKKIPYSQEGRKIFYRTEDVEKFMEERRISSK